MFIVDLNNQIDEQRATKKATKRLSDHFRQWMAQQKADAQKATQASERELDCGEIERDLSEERKQKQQESAGVPQPHIQEAKDDGEATANDQPANDD